MTKASKLRDIGVNDLIDSFENEKSTILEKDSSDSGIESKNESSLNSTTGNQLEMNLFWDKDQYILSYDSQKGGSRD